MSLRARQGWTAPLPRRSVRPDIRFLPLVVLAALAGASGCGGASNAKSRTAAEEPRAVRVATVRQGALAQVVTVSGTLAAEEEVQLGMKTAGRLGSISVDLGSRVVAGQRLASLDPTDFQLRVQQAEAALEQARARVGVEGEENLLELDETAVVRQARATLDEARLRRDRFARLFEQQLVSEAERDAAEASFLVAEGRYQDALEEARNRRAVLAQRRSELALARQQLADTVLAAPFDGGISERHAAPGQYVTPGQPIVTLVRVHPLRLRVDVPEREAQRVRTGQDVEVTVEGDGGSYPGRVARLSPALDEASRTLSVEAEIPNPDGRLRAGSFARARIVTAADQPAVLVPRAAITTFAGLDKVIVIKDGRSEERRVVTGRTSGDLVEIVSGVVAGEPVVLEPGNLVGGRPVRVVE